MHRGDLSWQNTLTSEGINGGDGASLRPIHPRICMMIPVPTRTRVIQDGSQ